jgi:hypothetical protein
MVMNKKPDESKETDPLPPEKFPLTVDGKKIKDKEGDTVATTNSVKDATEIAERLNEDEERKEEDRWSA